MATDWPNATARVVVFKAYLASDHVSVATGKTIVITISKNGGAFGNPNAGATNATEISSGFYKFTLDTTDTGTNGPLAWRGAVATVDDVGDVFDVVNAANGKLTGIPNAVAAASGGLLISGSNAGTTTLAALTITGVTTHTGNVVLSDGLTISAPSTSNRAGFDITGNGTGAALKLAAGATGKGIAVTTTAGDGLSILPTAGSAIVATGNGTSKHGAIITGGTAGTSDGISCVAGTGGVDFRGSITGSLSGAVGSVTSSVNVGQLAGQTVTAAAGVTFPTSIASPTNITAGTITTVTNLTNAATAGDLTATMSATVKTQVVAALSTDTYAEPAQGAPGATISLASKIGFLYKAWRNKKTETSGVQSLYNDDAATVDHKTTVSDDGTTTTVGEMATGP